MAHTSRAIPVDRIKLIVLDLDGTLIDSRTDLANSVNAMLTQLGRQPLPEEIIATYIGDGAGMLVRRALGDPHDEPLVEDALNRFLEYYREHKLDHTYVYEGVFEALDHLRNGNRQLAVLTNKPVGPAQVICDHLGLAPYFFQIYGGNSFETKKPDPFGLRRLLQEANAAPEEAVMIGDSDVDILTAQRAGTWAIGCLFGLSSHTLESIPADFLAHRPLDWITALGGPQPVSR
ncbi:HAD family hydrolase [Acidipila rosea]|uniref:phosphoglycolate phosphatase n=1 Tax=Acidipila rosea TaxID=768535 RepID=A0A4R1L7G1_9BACT|nr:HAD-IA family hydrolase [Acidipila rosea]MBW4043843.1 HAD-IA family hydrolase [Acidobacteriota bacterium]TCK74145.1 phosphoglycolate phosphatase [Acidipila rosea]